MQEKHHFHYMIQYTLSDQNLKLHFTYECVTRVFSINI